MSCSLTQSSNAPAVPLGWLTPAVCVCVCVCVCGLCAVPVEGGQADVAAAHQHGAGGRLAGGCGIS